ncbi:MAG: S8 family serine peptidase [Anaerolineae bacterium]|nr:S8 family serine peptidase [Anaerolineae bacterium]
MDRFFKLFALLAIIMLLVEGIPAATSSAIVPAVPAAAPLTILPATSPDSAARIPIRLANYTFDPLQEITPRLIPSGLLLQTSDSEQTGYYFVQFQGPVQQQWKEAVTAAGGQIMDYIPDFTFIVAMDEAARHTVEAMDVVRWVGAYHPIYRLEKSLLNATLLAQENQLVEVTIVVFKTLDVNTFAGRVQSLGGQILDTSQTHWEAKIHAHIPTNALNRIAALNGAKWIEPAPQWRLTNSEADNLMGVREVWDTHGLYGAGQVVAVCDTGLDQGSILPANLHDDFEDGSGNSRMIAIYDRAGDGANDVNSGHGTHVAGSVLGNGSRSGSAPASHTYPDAAYVGIAPEASLVFQAVENNANGYLTGIPVDLNNLFVQVIADNAYIHTNSWGAASSGSYNSYSEDVDQFIWDHPDFTILFSAGNEGRDGDSDGVVDSYSLDSPGTAKNCITVGASENSRASGGYNPGGACWTWGGTGGCWPPDYGTNPIRDDLLSDDPGGLAAFSSRGPVEDGRYKPDLVAPGTNIASTKSLSATAATGWGLLDPERMYMYMGGTSMATPLVAGAAALVRGYYVDRGITPSAALIKATLINGATDLYPGQYGTGSTIEIPTTRPTNVAGWGRVNVENALFPPLPHNRFYEDNTTGLQTGGVFTAIYTVTDPSDLLQATLVWSDYPGNPAANGGLVNDLDLSITGPDGTIHYPNNANPLGQSTDFDRANNVVGIDIATPSTGVYTVTVFGYNIPQGPQPFALVVSGGVVLNPRPVVSSISPNTGINTGIVQIADLTGSNFEQGATVKLTRSNHSDILADNVTVVSSTTITCTLDLSGVATGSWNVTVVNPDTQSGTLVDGFAVTGLPSAPVVTSITPDQGPGSAMVEITAIEGSNFLPGAAVKLSKPSQPDIVAHNVTVLNSSTITCTFDLRGAAAGYWNVVVTNSDEQSGTLSSGFYIIPPPTVASITPQVSSNNGTVHVTDLAGTDFQPTGTTTVTLEKSGQPDIVATNIDVVNTSKITCDFDLSGAEPGRWNVAVINPDGQTSILTNGFTIYNLNTLVYLPVIVNGYRIQDLLNGDFEEGPAHWTEYSSNGYDVILHESELPDVLSPRSGEWAVWLGGVDDEISFIQQQMRVPYGAPYLTYWHWIASEESCGFGFDTALVLVNDIAVAQYELCHDKNTNGWYKYIVDLHAYSEQSISLQIRAVTDGSLNSNLFVDDVAFQAGATSEQGSVIRADPSSAEPKPRQVRHK